MSQEKMCSCQIETKKSLNCCNSQNNISENWKPKIVAFLCNWCSYAGADLAGISRLQYPANVRIIRVPCSGRVNPMYILKALHNGADAVWVSG